MTQPVPYTRTFDFAGYSISNPATPRLPGPEMDTELNAIRFSLNAAITNLGKIQRDDNALANQTVGLDQLNDAVMALMTGGAFRVRGTWATSTIYAAGDLFISSGSIYLAASTHTSAATLSIDLAAGRVVGPLFTSSAATVRKVVATPATLASSDAIVSMACPGVASTIALPSAASITNHTFTVKDGLGQAYAHPITVTSAGGTIDGQATAIINQNYASMTFFSDGTSWFVI